jgi:hypothetical protein
VTAISGSTPRSQPVPPFLKEACTEMLPFLPHNLCRPITTCPELSRFPLRKRSFEHFLCHSPSQPSPSKEASTGMLPSLGHLSRADSRKHAPGCFLNPPPPQHVPPFWRMLPHPSLTARPPFIKEACTEMLPYLPHNPLSLEEAFFFF